MPNSTKPFFGTVYVKNVTDDDDVYAIPSASAMPRNPDQVGYPGLMNASAYPSVRVFGQKTPFFTISAPAKSSWFNYLVINDFLFNVDSDGNTDEFAFCFYDGSTLDYGAGSNGFRIFEGCRCSSLSVRMGTQGPVMVDMTFLARYGDDVTTAGATPYAPGRAAYTTAFNSSLPASDPGKAYGQYDVVFDAGAGLTHVASAGFTLNRGQGHIAYLNGTFYPTEVGSGMFSGTASLEQSPTGTSTLTGFAAAIGKRISGDPSGVLFTMDLSRDERVQDQNIGFGRVVRAYTMGDFVNGGNPCVVTEKSVAA